MVESALLSGLGVSATEEAAYRGLLRTGPATLSELAETSNLSTTALRRLLPRLEDLGLVSRLVGRPLRLVATPPTTAVDALVARRQEELAHSRAAASALTAEEAPRTGARPEELIEIVTGRDAVARKFRHLHETARDEVLVLVEPPFALDASVPNLSQEEGMRRGTRVRGIYGPNALEAPGMLGHIRRAVAAGEEARLGDAPVKLTVADRKTALLPLITEHAVAVESALVVHTSALLDALVSLFEVLWRLATPFDAASGGPSVASAAPHVEGDVIALLAAGMKDEAVARQLGMSARTLQRRLRQEFEELGARTRFQAGYRAGLRAAGDRADGSR